MAFITRVFMVRCCISILVDTLFFNGLLLILASMFTVKLPGWLAWLVYPLEFIWKHVMRFVKWLHRKLDRNAWKEWKEQTFSPDATRLPDGFCDEKKITDKLLDMKKIPHGHLDDIAGHGVKEDDCLLTVRVFLEPREKKNTLCGGFESGKSDEWRILTVKRLSKKGEKDGETEGGKKEGKYGEKEDLGARRIQRVYQRRKAMAKAVDSKAKAEVDYVALVTAIYRKHNPEKLKDPKFIPTLFGLAEYKGKEDTLLAELRKKYPEDATEATAEKEEESTPKDKGQLAIKKEKLEVKTEELVITSFVEKEEGKKEEKKEEREGENEGENGGAKGKKKEREKRVLKWWLKDTTWFKRRRLEKCWLQMRMKWQIALGCGLPKYQYVLSTDDGKHQMLVKEGGTDMIGDQIAGKQHCLFRLVCLVLTLPCPQSTGLPLLRYGSPTLLSECRTCAYSVCGGFPLRYPMSLARPRVFLEHS
jgi:hypothetical protein